MQVSFSPFFEHSEERAVQALFDILPWDERRAKTVEAKAGKIVEDLRKVKMPAGQLESFLHQYSLDTTEGLALMTLAEALQRIPDRKTANRLIKDKVTGADWLARSSATRDWIVKAAGLGLFMSSKTLSGFLSGMGEPVIREAMMRAMKVLGQEFVLGEDIESAVQNAHAYQDLGYRMSYDILGEGARTAADAEHYFKQYAAAIDYIGQRGHASDQRRPGISVKLSALHPRYEYAQKERCVPEMAALLLELAQKAAAYNLAFTVDAEEANRLNLSVEIIEAVMADPSLKGWDGFGLAVQAYHKATPALIDHMIACAKANHIRLQMRLVKGAYWDSEIKEAQVEGLKDFPVYTCKYHTDLSFLACSYKMLEASDHIYPMLATHNAHSIAAVMEMGEGKRYEFQRLFGMGQSLYGMLMKAHDVSVSVYAPVGPHKDLLPYLVRRLLENGANSSFVNRVLDHDVPVSELVGDPVEKSKNSNGLKHPKIQLPHELFEGEAPQGRVNSKGLDLNAPEIAAPLMQEIAQSKAFYTSASIISGRNFTDTIGQEVKNPGELSDIVGRVYEAGTAQVNQAFEYAKAGYEEWSGTDASVRAQALRQAADMLEERHVQAMALLCREAGKTAHDALAEIREAVDFLRYYAGQGEVAFAASGQVLPGPTGERNVLSYSGRGVFVCISPWNFPLAIFTGQMAAALMAGNAVLAKPAEQTPLIGYFMVEILHEAGVPVSALHLITGDGRIGAALCAHKDLAGVAFTGSTEVARLINQTLAAKNGPIVPLIAETGGQNAMIVDGSALPEQVVDDVLLSAFGSAGQRCSALRILCVHEGIADKMIRMIQGGMKELVIGNPKSLSSDVGPVIDDEARRMLVKHREGLNGFAKPLFEVPLEADLKQEGHYFGPCMYELPDLKGLGAEVFGPILHVVRYNHHNLPELLQDIANTGYGLTLGVHSRIESFQDFIAASVPAGNVYVNRSMIGAVVGSQPFGGRGLSGTGPKAGGPNYLQRFAQERVISVDTTAAGGNASLVTLAE